MYIYLWDICLLNRGSKLKFSKGVMDMSFIYFPIDLMIRLGNSTGSEWLTLNFPQLWQNAGGRLASSWVSPKCLPRVGLCLQWCSVAHTTLGALTEQCVPAILTPFPSTKVGVPFSDRSHRPGVSTAELSYTWEHNTCPFQGFSGCLWRGKKAESVDPKGNQSAHADVHNFSPNRRKSFAATVQDSTISLFSLPVHAKTESA